jgi:putative membrane protein
MERFLNAYCGEPPTPSLIWGRWNLDPILIAVLAAALASYILLAPQPRRSALAFYAGWAITAFALLSPICALSVALFSARVAQHVVLILIAAPLLASALPQAGRRRPLLAGAALSAALWFWHTPGPYAATFESDGIYWLMHATLFGGAIVFWRACLHAPNGGTAAVALLLVAVQMSLLGALLTFAPHPLFAPHLLTTEAWGLSQLSDQQLGGALMWAPGGLVFLAVALGVINLALSRLENGEKRQSA